MMFRHYYQSEFGGFFGPRNRRGDLGPIILQVLKEKPMHGYEIISQLEEKSHGMWRPSAGSIYPNLQLLTEQEYVTSKEENGKRVYTITEKGIGAAQRDEEVNKDHWEKRAAYASNFKELKTSFIEIMGTIKNIAAQDSPEKTKQVKKVLEETKEKLAKIAETQPIKNAAPQDKQALAN